MVEFFHSGNMSASHGDDHDDSDDDDDDDNDDADDDGCTLCTGQR